MKLYWSCRYGTRKEEQTYQLMIRFGMIESITHINKENSGTAFSYSIDNKKMRLV
jgi:hypothetical protein